MKQRIEYFLAYNGGIVSTLGFLLILVLLPLAILRTMRKAATELSLEAWQQTMEAFESFVIQPGYKYLASTVSMTVIWCFMLLMFILSLFSIFEDRKRREMLEGEYQIMPRGEEKWLV